MNEFKGTPGPWEVDGTEIYPVAGHRATDAICGMAVGFSDADAALIAAAPELLEALVIAVGNLKEICDVLGADRPQSTIRRAEAALSKALGEKP